MEFQFSSEVLSPHIVKQARQALAELIDDLKREKAPPEFFSMAEVAEVALNQLGLATIKEMDQAFVLKRTDQVMLSFRDITKALNSYSQTGELLRHARRLAEISEGLEDWKHNLERDLEKTSSVIKLQTATSSPEGQKQFENVDRLLSQANNLLAHIRDQADQLATKLSNLDKRENVLFDTVAAKTDAALAQVKSLSEESTRQIEKINRLVDDRLTEMQREVEEKVQQTADHYEQTMKTLDMRKGEVEKLVGTITGGVMANNYETSAKSEKDIADLLRLGSLVCMFAIACVIGYSLYETTLATFKWENAIARVVFSIFLSVPAAYLARESAKHREQQYTHLQTSLDLKAITPYLASLPDAEQHRLKAEIANRLFAAKDFRHLSNDSYPINSHEMLMALISKMELPKTKRSETKQDNT